MMKVRNRSRLDSRDPEQSTIIEQPSATDLILSASFTQQLDQQPSTQYFPQNQNQNKKAGASFSFETQKPEAVFANQSIQCDLETKFDQLDFRKCLRCGLNDKSSGGVCVFHPSKPKMAGGSGDLLYSSDWHLCREKCKSISSDYQPLGCKTNKSHFYGTNIPYKPRSQSRSPRGETPKKKKAKK